MKKIYTIILLFHFLTLSSLSVVYGQCRNTIVDDYKTNYLGSATTQAEMGWTSDISTCSAGTISAIALSKTLQRLNYYRRLTGLNDNVTFNAAKNTKSQEASLMMLRNQALNHAPPSTWACYTADGYQAASQGNLAAGSYGAGDIDNWISDNGTPSAGHRRWILAPDAAQYGYGSIKGAGWYWLCRYIDGHRRSKKPDCNSCIRIYSVSGFRIYAKKFNCSIMVFRNSWNYRRFFGNNRCCER